MGGCWGHALSHILKVGICKFFIFWIKNESCTCCLLPFSLPSFLPLLCFPLSLLLCFFLSSSLSASLFWHAIQIRFSIPYRSLSADPQLEGWKADGSDIHVFESDREQTYVSCIAFVFVHKGWLQGLIFQDKYFLPLVPCQWEKLIILNIHLIEVWGLTCREWKSKHDNSIFILSPCGQVSPSDNKKVEF